MGTFPVSLKLHVTFPTSSPGKLIKVYLGAYQSPLWLSHSARINFFLAGFLLSPNSIEVSGSGKAVVMFAFLDCLPLRLRSFHFQQST